LQDSTHDRITITSARIRPKADHYHSDHPIGRLELKYPGGVALLSATSNGCKLLAVADSGNHRVVVLRAHGISTSAWRNVFTDYVSVIGEEGSGDGRDGSSVQFKNPWGVAALDRETSVTSWRLAVSDTCNHRVVVLDALSGAVERIFGRNTPGPGEGQLHHPHGMSALGDGLLAVADTSNDRVVVMNVGTGAVERTIGTKGTGEGNFDQPWDVAGSPSYDAAPYDGSQPRAVGHDWLAVTDMGNNRVVVVQVE
jgi:hypothetical protein